MAQQYGYGYGQFQAYGYGQQAPVGYVQYGQQRVPYGGQQQQQVGYSYPQQQQQQQKPSQAQAQVPPPPPPPGTNQASTFYSGQHHAGQQATPQQQQHTQPQSQQQQHGYFTYPSYRPSTGYQSYYQHQQHQQPSTPTTAAQTGGVGYQPPTLQASTTSSPAASVSYPTYASSGYASSANAYFRQKQQQQQQQSQHQSPQQPSPSSYTPQQQRVISQYIQQKHQSPSGTPNFPGRKPQRPYPSPQQQPIYYCEVCRISCASAATYKTHLEGKSHKKKLQQQQITSDTTTPRGDYYCELCDVSCTSKDAFEAHIRGAKHQKVETLHRRLGKPIPEIKMPAITNTTTAKATASIATKEGKPVTVNVARITFVGGTKLTSTDSKAEEENVLKVYPPGASVPKSATPQAAKKVEVEEPKESGGAPEEAGGVNNGGGGEEVHVEIQPVGEDLVIAVKSDPKFPHATFKCTLCDCYFNDDYAKKGHVKGRRHRLNYKKMYQPDLYVEPTKQQKKEMEKRKRMFEQRRGQRMRGGMMNGRGGGGGGGAAGQVSPQQPRDQPQVDLNELRRQEAAALAQFHAQKNPPVQFMEDHGFDPYYCPPEEMFGGGEWGWEGEPFPLPPPRNPHDDRLVLNKHGSIYPQDTELKAVQHVVADIEKALKLISDDMLAEKCQEDGKETQKDEDLRELKGVMRVGAFARGLLLRGECTMELVLMCTEKPTLNLFNVVANRLPAKFESFTESDNVYNLTPEPQKSALIVISQVGDYRVQVTITLTSTQMRDEPSPEQAAADQEAGVLDRPSCLAALAALRHTKWFQAMAHGLPSCVIVMRVLKDICQRVPAWGVLDTWMLELLVQKCIISANPDFTRPGDVFRRVMECVASDIFLPGGTGLLDPCEKGKVDAASCLSAQERANITLSAQHALRLIAFQKLHLVLGVEPLPPPGTPKAPVKREAVDEQESEGENGAKKIKLEA